VADLVHRLRLLEEALRDLHVLRELGVQELDGHDAPGEHVLRAVHVAHPAAADALREAVLALDESAGGRGTKRHQSRGGYGCGLEDMVQSSRAEVKPLAPLRRSR
jgi:hypothetical protein